jgi:hypothetical protein
MRRLLLLIAWLVLCGFDTQQGQGLVRSYHFDRSGSGSSNLCDTSVGCPTLGLWFGKEVAATYAADIGAYTLTVNGNPTRVSGPTWPSGLVTPGYNWRFDGTGDYLSLADDPAFEVQDFSVFMCVIPRAGWGVNEYLITKYSGGGADARSWMVYTQAADGSTLQFLVNKAGTGNVGDYSTHAKTGAFAINRLTCFTAAYDYVGAANSIMSIWVDELAVATNNAQVGPPFNGDRDFTIGGTVAGGQPPADIFVAAYYPGVLTAADHQRLNRRFRGLYDGSGNNPVTVTAATMPAIQMAYPTSGVTPFLIDQPANSNMIGAVASGSGGLYGSSAIVNKCWRSSFETGAALTGWTIADGGTTGACAQSCIAPVHGSCEAACSTADADDTVTLTSGCATVTGGTSMWVAAWLKTAAGTGLVDVNVIEDDSADCATPTTTTAVINDAVPGAAYVRYSGAITLQAGTIRAQVQISLPAAAAQTTYIDAVTFRAGIATDAFCTADTDADASCSTMVQSVADNGSLISANGSSSIVGTFRSPWAGTDATGTIVMATDGTAAAANSLYLSIASGTDEPAWNIYDGASAGKVVSPNVANWAAATDYTLKARRDGAGAMGLWWNAAWNVTTGGAGTGIRSASQALLYICGSNAAGSDVWLRDLQAFRRRVD